MKKYYTTVLFFISFLYSCNTNKIDKQIVLKIGKLEITKYEFNKNKGRGLNDSTKNDTKSIIKWKKQYLNDCLIVADAYERSYDTLKIVQKLVENTSRIMMVQKYGYLWKKTISPFEDTFTHVTSSKSEKRKKMFYFDYIQIKNYEGLKNVTGNDTVIKTLAEYNKLKNKCHQYPFLETGYISQQWPFIAFWELKDYLYNMKESQISKLIYYEGNYYYFYLDHIENIEITQKEKDNFQSELALGFEKEIEYKMAKEIEKKCQPVFNYENVDVIAKYISNNHSIFEFNNNFELLHYKIDNTNKVLNFDTFREYYYYLILKHNINNKETLLSYINQYYHDDYLSNEAEKLGLYKTDTFLLDQKNFKNNVVNGEYVQMNIIDKIKIDLSEIVAFYNKNKMKFIQPKSIILDLYAFDKNKDAFENMHKIMWYIRKNQPHKTNDPSIIKGLHDFTPNYKINLECNENYPDEFLNETLTMNINTLSNKPILYNNKYVLIYKRSEEGQCIKKLKNAYSQIEAQIKNEKINLKVQELLLVLSKKYKVEIDKTGI